jgi:hypothetical protein
MATKAATSLDKTTPRGGSVPVSSDPPELSVLVVQFEALEHDEAIRRELKSKGFAVKHQAMVTLSPIDAREFLAEVCNPQSERYRSASSANPATSDTELNSQAADVPHSMPSVGGESPERAIEALSR